MRLSDCMKQESLQQLYAQICIKLDKTTSFQIWGLQVYFLMVQPLSSKTNAGESSSIALEQYPWSTVFWTIRQALLWGKFCCDAHTFCHAYSMADAWVDWKYLRGPFPFKRSLSQTELNCPLSHALLPIDMLQKCVHWGDLLHATPGEETFWISTSSWVLLCLSCNFILGNSALSSGTSSCFCFG